MTTELLYDLTTMRTLLSNTAAFRTWCGESTPTLALAHVKLFGGSVEDPPVCVLSHGPGWTRELSTLSAFSTMPQIMFEFVQTADVDTDDETAFTSLLTSVDTIMQAVEAQVSTGYPVTRYALASDNTPERASLSSGTDYVSVRIIADAAQR